MALVVADRVKETTTSTGTGPISLGGAEPNFRAFSSVLADADTTYYAIIDNNNLAFEVGLGTYASSGNTITRTTVLSSSNSDSAVNFSAGTKDVILTYPADKSAFLDGSDQLVINGTAVTSTAADLNLVDGATADTVVNSKAVIYGAAGQVTANELDVDNIQIDANAIKSTDTNGNIQLFPNGTGFTELYGNTNAGKIRFNCEVNSHGVTLQGPPHSAGATYTLELPDADGSSGEVLKTDGSGKLAFTSTLRTDGINDTNGAELIKVTATGSAVNEVTLANAATGNNPALSATGDDTNVGIDVTPKGTGEFNVTSSFMSGVFSDRVNNIGNTGTAVTIDCDDGNVFTATLTGNCTFTLASVNSTSNRATSFTLVLTNDATASRTVAFAGGTFYYPGGSVTRTEDANAVDIWFFFSPDGGTTWYVSIPMADLATS